MNCPKCAGEVPRGAAFCPSCGAAAEQEAAGRGPAQVSVEWLRQALGRDDYETEAGEGEDVVRARHKQRPNVVLRIRRDLGVITIQHWWGMKKRGLLGGGGPLEAVNKANSVSWLNTFCLDKDGDLGVSSFIVLAERLGEQDVRNHLDQATRDFMATVATSGLEGLLK